MNHISEPKDGEAASAARKLAQLNEQVEEARATLIRLRLEVTKAQRRVNSSPAGRLAETNQMLVVSALQALTDAETTSWRCRKLPGPLNSIH